MPKEAELIEPPPTGIGEETPKEEPKPDPFKELEARLEAKFQKEIQARDDKIASLSKPVSQPGPTVVEKIDIYEKLGTKIWENTPEALREIRNEIKREVTEELTKKYDGARGEERFWDEFYRENAALDRKEDHWIVQAIVNEKYSAWKDKTTDEVRGLLKSEAEKRLAKWEAKKGPKTDSKAPSLSLQSASPTHERAEPEKQPNVVTLSQVIKKRQALRRESFLQRAEARGRDDKGRYSKETA